LFVEDADAAVTEEDNDNDAENEILKLGSDDVDVLALAEDIGVRELIDALDEKVATEVEEPDVDIVDVKLEMLEIDVVAVTFEENVESGLNDANAETLDVKVEELDVDTDGKGVIDEDIDSDMDRVTVADKVDVCDEEGEAVATD
jgi:hypothetical protein